ncbi:hypothetical protein CANARDRAFT_212762 [[Candida] arabinofermentans NRRL YB-2248]|uniref:Cysteine-rich transmembrane domain-containing protein n=1 Tax=[Candida] arabinofermentans NRRL YB-2248 TaxID=983967 RepID=A0A1E4T0E5_9ASCO|nr:hypothetical protein CANARDRAFT_212762 [[Candida] arabinofermentans NRRL YB-2248]
MSQYKQERNSIKNHDSDILKTISPQSTAKAPAGAPPNSGSGSAADYYNAGNTTQEFQQYHQQPQYGDRGVFTQQPQQPIYGQQQGYYQQQQPVYGQQQGYYQQQPQPIYVQQQQPQRSNNDDCLLACLGGLCLCCTLDAIF